MAVIFGKKGPDPEAERFQQEWHDWSQSENIEGLRSALEEGQDINEIVTNGYTSATIAAKNDLVRVFEFLREQGADMGKADGNKRTPLMWAALSGSKRVAQKMLSRADGVARLSQGDETGKQPLHFASMGGQTSLVEILISKGADVNAQDHEGRTPLHYSMVGGTPSAVKALLAGGANASLTDKEGRPPEKMPRATTACKNALSEGGHGMGGMGGMSSMMSMGMGSHGSSSSSASASHSAASSYAPPPPPPPFSAADAAALDPDEADEALFEALAEEEDETTAELLVSHAPANLAVSHPEYLGATALHLASSFASAGLIEALVSKGAPIDALDAQGRTALFWALEAENAGAASALIKAGADVSIPDETGVSCQQKALDMGMTDLADQIESSSQAKKAKPRV